MSLTGLAFLAVFLGLAAASLVRHPVYGVVGYFVTYVVSPATRWWGAPLAAMGLRFSYFIAIVALVSFVLHFRSLRPGLGVSRQEVTLWLFVAVAWIVGWSTPPIGWGDDQAVKLTKAAAMLFLLRRTVDDVPKVRLLVWALLLASAYGAFDTRLSGERIGARIHSGSLGSDFQESNFLAAHLSAMLPFLGVLFLRARWKTRALLAVAAALFVDLIVQCRSRGAFLAILAGAAAGVLWAPRGTRKKVYALVLVGVAGALALTDAEFWDRMGRINTRVTAVEEQDDSAAGRIVAWRAALAMVSDHPLGVGYNNFKVYVEHYAPTIPGKDTHNTYLRCLAELGVQGAVLLALLIVNALLQTFRLRRNLERDPDAGEYSLLCYATAIALLIYLAAGMFISATYVEEFYLLLLLPDVLASCYAADAGERALSGSVPSSAGVRG